MLNLKLFKKKKSRNSKDLEKENRSLKALAEEEIKYSSPYQTTHKKATLKENK